MVLVRLKEFWTRFEAASPHLLSDGAVDSVGANNNVSRVFGAVFGLDMDEPLHRIQADNTFPRQNLVFGLEVVEKNLQERLSVDENLGIAGSIVLGSAYKSSRSDPQVKGIGVYLYSSCSEKLRGFFSSNILPSKSRRLV